MLDKALHAVFKVQVGKHMVQVLVPYNPELSIDDVMQALFEIQQDLLTGKKVQEAAALEAAKASVASEQSEPEPKTAN